MEWSQILPIVSVFVGFSVLIGFVYKRQDAKMDELNEALKLLKEDHKADIERLDRDAQERSRIYARYDICQQKHEAIAKELGRGNELFEKVLTEIQAQSSLTIRNDERLSSITKQMDAMTTSINTLLSRAFDQKEAQR